MLYKVVDGTLSAGSTTVLTHFNFEIKGKDHIAIVGPNGSGKTTLLRMIAGELEPDRDDKAQAPVVTLARSTRIAMLHQQAFSETDHTVEEEIMAICPCRDSWDRERFDFEQEYDRIFTGLGFTKGDKQKKLSEFSGGQQTKIALVRLLLEKPDILLLDEPTNHLDLQVTAWLEDYLRSYPRAVVMVSHDRFFLDETAEIVYELADGRLTRYVGNYSDYRQQKLKKIQIQKKQYEQQQAEIGRLSETIERFKHKPKKAAMARAKKKQLERMDRYEKPEVLADHIFTGEMVPEVPSAKWVLEAEKLKIGYDHPLAEISLRVRRGQKIGIIGPNGAGKSTFIKTVAEKLQPLAGKCQIGQNVSVGYFDQLTADISGDDSVIEHFKKHYPGLNEKEARQHLAGFLFGGAEAAKKISMLSGGEKSRLVLAELLKEVPNFLVLDEPTNHMDIPAKETLESAFNTYKGTMLFVSHDRYFIDRVADSLLIFDQGEVFYYPFSYRHYLLHLEKMKQRQELLLQMSRQAANSKNANGDGNTDGTYVNSHSDQMPAQELGSVISVEDQVLLTHLQNVPKGSSLLGRELSTETAFLEWQKRLAMEALEKESDRLEELQRQKEQMLLETMDAEGIETEIASCETAHLELSLKWYDLWQELHPLTAEEEIKIFGEE